MIFYLAMKLLYYHGQQFTKFKLPIKRLHYQGYQFAGTQWRRECFCGNDYADYGTADNCNLPCTGNSAAICGGDWALSVYKTSMYIIDMITLVIESFFDIQT